MLCFAYRNSSLCVCVFVLPFVTPIHSLCGYVLLSSLGSFHSVCVCAYAIDISPAILCGLYAGLVLHWQPSGLPLRRFGVISEPDTRVHFK